jgi:hypothetical protein
MPTAFWKPAGAPETAWTRVVNPTLPGLVTALDPGVPTMFVSAEDAVTILEREAGIEIIPLARQVSNGLPSFTVDFNVTDPLPEGVTATYEAITVPTPGATLVGSQLTVFFDEASAGLYVVRRTRSDAVVEEFRFNLTVVQPVITVPEDREFARINFGADDPDATTYPLTVTDPGPEGGPEGPFDGETINFTRSDLNALIGADPPRVHFEVAPVIARETGSGPLALGDVAREVSGAVWAQPDIALVPVTPEWVITDAEDNHVVIPDETGPTVARPATPGLILRRRYLDGTGLIWSNPLDLAALDPGQPPGLDLWGSVTGFLSTTSTTTPTFTYANEGMKAGNSLMLVYSGPGGASALVGAETANVGTAIAGVTVNGNAAILRQNNGNGEGLRHWVFQHILTADADTLEIILTLSTAFANHMLTAYTVKNGVFSSVGIGVATSALSALTGAGGNISVAGSADFVTAHRLVGQGSVAWSSDKSGFTEVALSTPNARQRFGKNLNLTTAAPTNPAYTSTGDVASNMTLSAIRFTPAP